MADDKDPWAAWTVVKEAASTPDAAQAPQTMTALKLAAAGGVVPSASRLAMEVATNPNVARAGSTAGQVLGGIEGAIHGGPMGAAGGVWTGGKAGWFTGKLAQKLAGRPAAVLEKLAPYAQTLSTLAGAQGVNDLAQIAEPNRRDIGVLGIGPSSDAASTNTAPNPANYTPNPIEQAKWMRDQLTAFLRRAKN